MVNALPATATASFAAPSIVIGAPSLFPATVLAR